MTTGEETWKVAPAQPAPDGAATNGVNAGNGTVNVESEPPASPKKRNRTNSQDIEDADTSVKRVKGVAPIKAEFLIRLDNNKADTKDKVIDDDAAEGADAERKSEGLPKTDARDGPRNGKNSKKDKKQKGQNTSRTFGSSRDKLPLCGTRAVYNEFSPKECPFGEKCKFEHDIRKYLKEGRREDLTTFDGQCPVYAVKGFCHFGWKCRFVGSHSEERTTEDGRQELVLKEDPERKAKFSSFDEEAEAEVVNIVPKDVKIGLSRRKIGTPRADQYIEWIEKNHRNEREMFDAAQMNMEILKEEKEARRAEYVEAPFRPSEKRRLYYGPETPMLAPLTTQGNMPYRRLCVDFGCQVTWSEMAMGMPLIQGDKGEWPLLKAHESEITPPKFLGKNTVVQGYDNSTDMKFGAQIAANKPWLATKTVEVLTEYCPKLRAIDLNCGCPINLVCEKGSGSALLDSEAKLEHILRGMTYVSKEVPITVKIRMGTKDNHPTAQKLIKRLVLGGHEAVESGKGTSGIAAITLHGRSKQQRYSRSADWSYIAECSALINRLRKEQADRTDTVAEADPRDLANGGHVYFVGNGDCYSHEDYYNHLDNAGVDTVMVGRGALIKPWLFEEIEKGQYLDKSASERLSYIEKFTKYGLQTWGSDEMGIGTTRRFLLEWLSFAHRYVPVGLLEHLPPNIQDRPPRFRGRNDLETLMASEHYKDWIKLSEMFLGPAHPNFKFEPKHKSNAYEIEAEG
ncbi:tRNA-dihydrouridine(47) synthase [NAD(P)(+)] [Alternaria tenuissima]|uniref:tRNA-dihydrouridine(47) synthase [NAD(P)(+)] n=1 Tax=Alternaria tenuissima TaxID=119927 RepID=A0ABY0GBS2_9PLEO|nr:tRNA-dihydrouridine(47) synthase [NAD(P)(+)] [Alternaria tenuissima]RYO11768.1 tRNA-dihydrouridine(47) synthase [NAD(P)(+)] [Alternaria tenuissima]RYO62780.1 tRNA-dihydrouridine(47) synthase [NAD(P)(+)] [Alternaria tenuissima]